MLGPFRWVLQRRHGQKKAAIQRNGPPAWVEGQGNRIWSRGSGWILSPPSAGWSPEGRIIPPETVLIMDIVLSTFDDIPASRGQPASRPRRVSRLRLRFGAAQQTMASPTHRFAICRGSELDGIAGSKARVFARSRQPVPDMPLVAANGGLNQPSGRNRQSRLVSAAAGKGGGSPLGWAAPPGIFRQLHDLTGRRPYGKLKFRVHS